MKNYIQKEINEEDINIIAEILYLPTSLFPEYISCLDILDIGGSKLYLIHYNQDKADDMYLQKTTLDYDIVKQILKCRGIIIDMTLKKIICNSYGYTINIEMNNIPNLEYFIKNYDEEILVIPEEVLYKKYYDGVLVRIWNYNNITLFSTYKKINAINSKLDNSEKFIELFKNNQNTFDIDNFDHKTINYFLINDKNFIIDSRINFDKTKIFYIESFTKDTFESVKLDLSNNDKPVFLSEIIDIKEANLLLNSEKIILFYENKEYVIISPEANWRKKLINGRSNVRQIFISLINNSNNLKDIDVETVLEKNKYYKIFSNLYFALPKHKIDELFIVYNKINDEYVNAAIFLYEHGEKIKNLVIKKELDPKSNNVMLINNIVKIFNNTKIDVFYDKKPDFTNWNESMIKEFNIASKKCKDCCNKKENCKNHIIYANILIFISKLYGPALYDILTLPIKFNK